jgi:transposase
MVGLVARRYRPVVRDQEFLLPPSMAEWLPDDHLVWFVIDVVDRLDTRAFHARAKRGGVGRQGYDPDMLLALLVYAYAVGERSSRRIERLCVDHVAFRVVCGQDPPDHTTLARFRGAHQDAFAGLFGQVLRLAAEAGMVRVGVVSIDGTKIAADAARGANRTPEWIRREAARLALERAEQVVAEAAEVDQTEDDREAESGESGEDDDRLPPGLADRDARAANITRALAELDRQDAVDREADTAEQQKLAAFLARVEAGETPPGAPPVGLDLVTYHQARIRRLERRLEELAGVQGRGAAQRRGDATKVLKKARAALTEAEQAAAEGTLDTRGTRARHRARREARLKARGGTGRTVNTTDPDSRLLAAANGGSVQGYNAQVAVTDDHLILGVHLSQDANDTCCLLPTLSAAKAAAELLGLDIHLVLADAGYFTEANLTAPGPDRLIAPGKHRDLTGQNPATGPPPPDASPKDAMRHRLRTEEGATAYKRRSATVEPVIGHLKELIGLTRFSRRGLPAVTAELHLAAAVHNLRRMHAAAPSIA